MHSIVPPPSPDVHRTANNVDRQSHLSDPTRPGERFDLPQDEVLDWYAEGCHHMQVEVRYAWGETPTQDTFDVLQVRDRHGPWVDAEQSKALAGYLRMQVGPVVLLRMLELRDGAR